MGTALGMSNQDTSDNDRALDDDASRSADPLTVEAVGKVTEALETVERARGHLYSFHQLTGSADLALGEGVDLLREAGHGELADRLERELVGRNVIPGHWTFQVVEAYDDTYWSAFRDLEKQTRDALTGGRRHLFEAGMKEERRTHGRPGHSAGPPPTRPGGRDEAEPG
jgi:nucleotide-binding universal stress UspA family protein